MIDPQVNPEDDGLFSASINVITGLDWVIQNTVSVYMDFRVEPEDDGLIGEDGSPVR